MSYDTTFGDSLFSKMDKINSELLSMTYGAFVVQILRDCEDPDAVNRELEKIGYNIGVRLIEEFLAKSGITQCTSFQNTVQVIAKVAFKMYLNTRCEIGTVSDDGKIITIIIHSSSLEDFVVLPKHLNELVYSNILCGVIRGALEMVNLRVTLSYIRDYLHGDDVSEIEIRLKEVVEDIYEEKSNV